MSGRKRSACQPKAAQKAHESQLPDVPGLKRNDEAVHRSIAIHKVDPLHRDADGAIAHDQTMEVCACEQPLLLAAILDQDEFRAYERTAVRIRVRKAHVSHDPARAGSRLLRIDPWTREPADARLKQPPIVIHQRNSVMRTGLVRLARDPVVGVLLEQRQPLVEPRLVEQARLVEEKVLALAHVGPVLTNGREPTQRLSVRDHAAAFSEGSLPFVMRPSQASNMLRM